MTRRKKGLKQVLRRPSFLVVKYAQSTPPAPPAWMKVRLRMAVGEVDPATQLKQIVDGARLSTVCQEASCPNLGHCWAQGSATFMIMGERCTRRCGFCDIATGKPLPLEADEPERLAQTVARLGLRHVVITSVDRDDLPDCGSAHFAAVIAAVRRLNPGLIVETLIPDFRARLENLERIWLAAPDIVNHNVETVPELYRSICPQSNYEHSLRTLQLSAERGFLTKSGIILGLGETEPQVRTVIEDLAAAGTTMLTIGQYLQPSRDHAPLLEYAPLERFAALRDHALQQGFLHVEAGPLVRSSYHAGDSFEKLREALKKRKAGRP